MPTPARSFTALPQPSAIDELHIRRLTIDEALVKLDQFLDDAFMAGLAVNYGEGKSLAEAVCWGNAAGALAAMRFGAQTSLPERSEVEGLLRADKPEQVLGRRE